jgi:hypothetical protein
VVSYSLNEDEVALINAFRLLTTTQRQMILRGVTAVTGKTPRLRLATNNNVLQLKRSPNGQRKAPTSDCKGD